MRNKTVFDFDDTLIDFMNPFVSWHKEIYRRVQNLGIIEERERFKKPVLQ